MRVAKAVFSSLTALGAAVVGAAVSIGGCGGSHLTLFPDEGGAPADVRPDGATDTGSEGCASTCTSPPAPSCANDSTRRSYASTGTCSGGTCSYAPTDAPCPAPANADPACGGGVCSYSCRSGYVSVGAACFAHDSWATVASMPTPRSYVAAATASGRVYAIGGKDGAALATVEAYSPTTGSWTTVARLPTARYASAAATGTDGRIYVIGGCTGDCSTSAIKDNVEVYTPSTDKWTAAASLPTPRNNLAAAVGPDGRIYAAGGYGPSGAAGTLEIYTPATNHWETVASMPTARGDLATVFAGGAAYVIGGWNNTAPVAAAEAFDPNSGQWTTRSPLPIARSGVAGVSSNGRIFVAGGFDGSARLTTFTAYLPAGNAWTTMASMSYPHDAAGAALGPDGRIYVVGGKDALGNSSAVVEAYTP